MWTGFQRRAEEDVRLPSVFFVQNVYPPDDPLLFQQK